VWPYNKEKYKLHSAARNSCTLLPDGMYQLGQNEDACSLLLGHLITCFDFLHIYEGAVMFQSNILCAMPVEQCIICSVVHTNSNIKQGGMQAPVIQFFNSSFPL
jgi:hypothetical protein